MTRETGVWMPMFWRDYFGDTMHLTLEESGAYLHLIGTYWVRGKALPDDDKWLAVVTKSSTQKWKKLRPKVVDFFEIKDGLLTHRRVEKEILKSNNRLLSARTAGIASGATRRQPTTTTKKKRKTPSESKEKRGTRLPADWEPSPEDIAFCLGEGLSKDDAAYIGNRFRDYWHGKAGAGGVKLDWAATWRNWVRRDISDGVSGSRAPHRQRQEPPSAVAAALRVIDRH